MTTKTEYDNVDKIDFAELYGKSMREKSKKKFKPAQFSNNNDDFVLFTAPPPKVAVNISSLY